MRTASGSVGVSARTAGRWLKQHWRCCRYTGRTKKAKLLTGDFLIITGHVRMSLADYEMSVQRFFDERGQLHIYPQAASLLFAYQRQGTRIVMITGADEVVAKAYGRALGINDVISNRLKLEGQRIKGLEEPLCYGPGKVALAGNYLTGLNLTLAETAFYSDSHADLPLLEAVGCPVVLNPNPQLRAAAGVRNWPVLDWRHDATPAD
ncbi:MAG: hypothetical protein CSH37_14445 [Thalassolituus sp.]|nr:MAG: hypothetical protein CSH37_14445 [Thalassolituus sp.]